MPAARSNTAGVLCVPASILHVDGVLPATTLPCYILLKGALGRVQLALGLAMLAHYRRTGMWGSTPT